MLQAHGHRVLLIPPQYVKPFVKRSKNDRADAQAICEAAGRPGMSVVPVRSLDAQSRAVILKVRERLVHQRTQLTNAIRGHAVEFGLVGAKGAGRVAELMARLRTGREVPNVALRELERLNRAADALESEIDIELAEAVKADEVARRLMGVPGIGPIGAMTLVTTVEAARFESGRHFAAWLGLVPREHSSGGKQLGDLVVPREACALSTHPCFQRANHGLDDVASLRDALFYRSSADLAFGFKDRADPPHRLDRDRRLGESGERKKLAPALRPAACLDDRSWWTNLPIELVEPGIGVRLQDPRIAGQMTSRMNRRTVRRVVEHRGRWAQAAECRSSRT